MSNAPKTLLTFKKISSRTFEIQRHTVSHKTFLGDHVKFCGKKEIPSEAVEYTQKAINDFQDSEILTTYRIRPNFIMVYNHFRGDDSARGRFSLQLSKCVAIPSGWRKFNRAEVEAFISSK